MRTLIVLMILSFSSFALSANESTEGSAEEQADAQAAANAAADGEATEGSPPPAPVQARDPDDSFLPTDQLRYDQEVDYPTDI